MKKSQGQKKRATPQGFRNVERPVKSDQGKELVVDTKRSNNRTPKLQRLPNEKKKTTIGLRGGQKDPLPSIKKMEERFDAMLKGCLDDLPEKSPSVVRIFLSSTFSDYRAERNFLAKEGHAVIKDYCSNVGLDFEVLDMRWGITDDATNEHSTEALCLQEITRCQKVSLGPNFVTMLGNRYGFRPVPPKLPVEVYDAVVKEGSVINHPATLLMDKWYRLDENAVPPVYLLQPIRTRIPDFGDYENPEKGNKGRTAWYEESARLLDLIHQTSNTAAAKGLISMETKDHICSSVTEQEVTKGILEQSNTADTTLYFLRRFDGLGEEQLQEKNAARHTDVINKNGQIHIDKKAEEQRQKLQDNVLPKALCSTNIKKYNVKWKEGGIDPLSDSEHKQYIQEFCVDFVERVIYLTERALKKRHSRIRSSEYYTDFDELLHHLHFTKDKCSSFRGRDNTFARVHKFLADNKNRKPLVIHAQSGAGKTSVMAMIMKKIPKWFGEDTIRVIRYLGTSHYSARIFDVLRGVMGQFGDRKPYILLEPAGMTDMTAMIEYFARYMRNVSRKIPSKVIILLDSLDQLKPDGDAYSVKWLPTELPPGVKLIVSTLPETHGILDALKNRIKDPSCFIELEQLPDTTSLDIIDSYMGSKGRKITDEQRELVMSTFQKMPTALFLKILLDQALTWKSYSNMAHIKETQIVGSVREAISRIFEELEIKFGKLLITAALGYITIGVDGMGNVELEDALSCNDEVLNEVYQYHDPPVPGVVRLPPVLWARIRSEIDEYLTERQSHGKTTLFWYHRQFIEAAEGRYTKGEKNEMLAKGQKLHGHLAKFYSTEGGVQRTLILDKRKITIENADRQITKSRLKKGNNRKLEGIFHHSLCSQDADLIKKNFFNLEFLSAYLGTYSSQDMIEGCMEKISEIKDGELQKLLNLLSTMNKDSVHNLPTFILSMLDSTEISEQHVSNLLNVCRARIRASSAPSLIPLYPCNAQVESESNTNCGPARVMGQVSNFTFSENDSIFIVNPDNTSKLIKLKDLGGDYRTVPKVPSNVLDVVPLQENQQFLLIIEAAPECMIIKLSPGEESPDKSLDLPEGIVLAFCRSKDGTLMYFLLRESGKCRIIIYDLPQGQVSASLSVTDKLDTGVAHMNVTDTGGYLVMQILLTEKERQILMTSEKRNNLTVNQGWYKFSAYDLRARISSLVPCNRMMTKIPTRGNCFELYEENTVIIGLERKTVFWNIKSDKCDQKLCKGTSAVPMMFRPEWFGETNAPEGKRFCLGKTLCIVHSKDQKHVAIGSEDGLMLVYDHTNGVCISGYMDRSDAGFGGGPVNMVVISENGELVAVIKNNWVLKLFSINEKGKEVFSMRLNCKEVKKILFSSDNQHLAVLTTDEKGGKLGRLMLFEVFLGAPSK